MTQESLARELYKAQEKVQSAIRALERGVDPKFVIAKDLNEALDTIEYLQSVA